MEKVKVYIDGQEGTTGLKILERFNGRDDIELLKIDEDKRKDSDERRKFINSSDFTFLCLPDDASREAVSMVENPNVRIIDASTAHRTNPDWAYGFPELSPEFRNKIKTSKRVAVPGCYASGFISLVYPLVQDGVFAPYQHVTSYAVSGYSGAGKKGIAQYEDENRAKEFDAPRMYALSQNHKHLKEMQVISGLSYPPMFNPMVCDYFAGMIVAVPVVRRTLAKRTSINEIYEIFKEHYKNEHFVKVMSFGGEAELPNGFMSANALEGTNNMQIFVCGNDEQILLCSRLDNLGKGASGAAVQCLNIMMGIDEKTGLE